MFTPVISYTPEQVMKCSEYLVLVWADVKVETWTVSGTRASPCDCNNLCCHPLCSCRCLMEAVLFCPTSTRRRILFTGHRVSRSPPTAMWLWLTPVITVLRCTVTFSDSASLSCTSTADPSRLLSCATCFILAGMDQRVLNNYCQCYQMNIWDSWGL